MASELNAPGVSVGGPDAFPPALVGVATAVPIFVGYTETAIDPGSKQPLYRQAVPLSSMAEYLDYFGKGYDAQAVVAPQPTAGSPPAPVGMADFDAASSNGSQATTGGYVVHPSNDMAGEIAVSGQFNLYPAMLMFFANGGNYCFVVSVGNYWGTDSAVPPIRSAPVRIDKADLLQGLAVADATTGAAMLVVPDACLLVTPADDGGPCTYPDYQPVAVEMLRQSGTLRDRMAILDLPGALVPANWTLEAMQAEAEAFYQAIAPARPCFSYGAAYGPALRSSLMSTADIPYTSLKGTAASTALMNNLLTTQALALYPPSSDPADPGVPVHSAAFQNVAAHIAAAFPVPGAAPIPSVPSDVTGLTTTPVLEVSMASAAVPEPAATDAAGIEALDRFLLSTVPLLGVIQQELAAKLNVVPPSGAMAGVWTQNDTDRGVWNAPANFALNQVVGPVLALTDDQQGGFNQPVNGNAINILRDFVSRGTVVWGARTLDGNSLDYRYIQVRRTLIYIEQSVRLGLQQFVFAPNDAATWTTVIATVSNFLTGLWQAGGLIGGKASDAFTVACGIPATMTGEDVLAGRMIVNVAVSMIHPAEYIALTFVQPMQTI